MKNRKVFKVAFTAIMISLAVVLEFICRFIPFLKMPYGGGISIAILPLAVVGVICGFYYSLASSIIYSLINCFMIDGYVNLISLVLDYFIAFSGLAVIALFRKQILNNKKGYLVLGFFIAMIIRWVSSGFSGVLNANLWGYDKAFLESIFGGGNGGVMYLYIYSFLIYNFPYIFVSTVLSIIICLSVYKTIFLNEIFN